MRAILERLDRIVASNAAILAELRRERPRPDRARVLPAIATAIGDRAFNAAEVLNHATVDRELAAVLDAARIPNARILGQYLRTIEGRTIGGVRVERIGEDREGIVWRVFVT